MPIFSSYVGGLSEVDVKIEQSVLACSSAASKIENNPQHTENNSEATEIAKRDKGYMLLPVSINCRLESVFATAISETATSILN